jgi:hypothetical protein
VECLLLLLFLLHLLLLLLLLLRYKFREVLAFSTSFFHLIRFLMQSFQFVIFILVISLFTSSHLFLGLPSRHVSAGDHSYTFFYHAGTPSCIGNAVALDHYTTGTDFVYMLSCCTDSYIISCIFITYEQVFGI